MIKLYINCPKCGFPLDDLKKNVTEKAIIFSSHCPKCMQMGLQNIPKDKWNEEKIIKLV